jgi:hypothetical protein
MLRPALDRFGAVPEGMRWCPHCDGYGSSLMEETERCTRGGGTGLVMVIELAEKPSNGTDPARPSH